MKKKDPLAPKRPQSAYFLWSAANRDKVKEELGGSPSGPEILRVLSKRWGELEAEAKAVYEEQSRVEKQKYVEAMAEYKLTSNSAKQQQAEEKKEETPVKKPSGTVSSSPFQAWVKEHRALVKEETGGKLTTQELAKELARRWKALDKQDKLSYKRKSSVEGEASSLDDKENSGRGSNKRSKMNKEAGARIRRARDAFQFYLLEAGTRIRAEAVDKRSVRQVHELALREWEALAQEARQKYVQMAVEDAQRVRREKQLPQAPEAGDNAE